MNTRKIMVYYAVSNLNDEHVQEAVQFVSAKNPRTATSESLFVKLDRQPTPNKYPQLDNKSVFMPVDNPQFEKIFGNPVSPEYAKYVERIEIVE